MRSTLTNRPTSGRLRASSIRLPTYMEATKPQNTCGCSVTSCGPGAIPLMRSAAISTAVTGPVGRPSASIGHERTGGGGVVGRLRPGDAGHRALAELLGPLRDAPLHGIGEEARDDVRRARDDADEEAQHRAARDRRRRLAPLLAARHQLGEPRRGDLVGHRLAGRGEDLAQPEQPHRHRHDAEAVAQLLDVEAVAEMPGHHVDADAADEQADRGHQQGADERRGRHVGEEHEPQHQQRGVFRRPEAQREVGERRRHQREQDHAEGAGHERADGGDGKRRAGAALARHGVAVDAGHDRGRPRRGCASGSRWWSRRTASRSRCRPA